MKETSAQDSIPEQQQSHQDLETKFVMKEISAYEASKVHETLVQPHQDLETKTMVKETSAQEASPSIPSNTNKIHEAHVDLEKESWEEKPLVKTYASILSATGGQPSVSPPVSLEWHLVGCGGKV
ncbi:hypothetical protein SESBI_15228 [Sesbania bispinosa]|nr:hypothetical protein SESBI_15228 [Sesbania bispinosa]